MPIKARAGETFKAWVAKLEALGYVVEYRVLDASQYGAPTKRKRFFSWRAATVIRFVAYCDARPEAPLKPLHTAAECIDWSLGVPVDLRAQAPARDKTLRRIAAGIERFVLNNPNPFIINRSEQRRRETNRRSTRRSRRSHQRFGTRRTR
jgi:DNA (cytosine-5)-methyltransferase 1